MIDMQKLLGQFLGGQVGTQRPSGPGASAGFGSTGGSIQEQIGGLLRTHGASALSGGLAGGIASQLFKGKGLSRMGGTALKLGGAALVAGLAYKAYQSYAAGNPGKPLLPGLSPQPVLQGTTAPDELPRPEGTGFLPAGEEEKRARLMLSAMIAAAKADGYIDVAEEEALFGRIDELGLDAEEKGFVMDELRRPASIDDLVARAKTPEMAIEVYTASVLSIDPDHPAERAYLQMLAARLNLPDELVAEIRRTRDEAVG